jgi:predicted nucleotidyltransferase component of viral defense system
MLDLEQIAAFYQPSERAFKKNLLREYLQYKILDIIFASDFASRLAFMGGTAIRIVYGSTRFSENLDFDNFGLNEDEFTVLGQQVQKGLALERYAVETKNVFKGAFHCHLSFFNVLYENNISRHKDEKLVIRLDTEPHNIAYTPEKVILNKFDVFTRISVVPEDMLLSQKISAILRRKRTMGRDFFDAIFLFGRTKPDFAYLDSKVGIVGMQELQQRLLTKSEGLNFKQLVRDVEPFLINSRDANRILLFSEYIRELTD